MPRLPIVVPTPEREERVHERAPPLGLGRAEMGVDVERLRVERHVREQHVVHLRHRSGEAMAEYRADREILEIEPAARMGRGRLRCGHRMSRKGGRPAAFNLPLP
jgi:hypothetical protein